MHLISWMNVVTRLASIERFSMERLACRESVLEHVGQVALTSYAVACELVARDPRSDVSIRECVCRALAHDLEELITGDIARPTKNSSSEASKMFTDLSRVSMNKLTEDLKPHLPNFAADVGRCHLSAKTERSGCVVALADILAVVTKVWEEVVLRSGGAMVRQAYTAERQLVAFQARLDREFDRDSESHRFLSEIVLDAVVLMKEAQKRDHYLLGTKVEEY